MPFGSVASASAKRPHRGLRVAGLVLGVVAAVVAVVYCAGCIFFYNRFWPNTTIGGADVSMMGPSQAAAAIDEATRVQQVGVSGQGVSFVLTGESAGLRIDAAEAVDAALATERSWQWPAQILQSHDDSDVLSASFDEGVLRPAVESQLAAHNSVASGPVDAFLYFDAGSGTYQVNPGSTGTLLDVDSVMHAVEDAVAAGHGTVALTSASLVQQSKTASDEGLLASRDAANTYLSCNLDLLVGGVTVASVNPATVRDWICFGEDSSVWLDEGALSAWVDALEATIDSAYTTRTYTRPHDGKVVTVNGGAYGWISNGDELDQLVRDAVYGGYTGAQDVPLKQSAETFNPGGRDWGNKYVDVDLTEQRAYFYDEWGSMIVETPIISGSVAVPDRATPEGVYYITNKALDQTLVGLPDPNNNNEPLYRTPVDYWMPFVGNMVGLHDASWQSYWGPEVYKTLDGSHGCVNLPPDIAEWCYGWIDVGTPVITHY